jgi:hypothetical protein
MGFARVEFASRVKAKRPDDCTNVKPEPVRLLGWL